MAGLFVEQGQRSTIQVEGLPLLVRNREHIQSLHLMRKIFVQRALNVDCGVNIAQEKTGESDRIATIYPIPSFYGPL